MNTIHHNSSNLLYQPRYPGQVIMHYLFPNFFVLFTLSAGIHAIPTGTAPERPSSATKVLAARETLASTAPIPAVSIVTWSDTACTHGNTIEPLMYHEYLLVEAGSFILTRDLLPGEQLDLSGANCEPYLGAAVARARAGPAAATLVPTLGNEWNPATGQRCYTVATGPAGCVFPWHHGASSGGNGSANEAYLVSVMS